MTEQWYAWLIFSGYQTVLLFIIVGSLELLAGRWLWPQLRLLLWSLLPLHLLVLPQWYFPWTVWQWVPVQSAQLTTATPQAISPVYFVLWLIGCLGVLLVLSIRLYRLRQQLLAHARPLSATPEYLLAAKTIGCRPPPLMATTNLQVPLVIGVLRPVIVIPDSIFKHSSSQDIQLALCHELGHIKRRDHWWAAINIGLASLAWFNPLVWFAVKRVNHLREFCCDALVVQKLGLSGNAYRQMLARAALTLSQSDRPMPGTQPAVGLLSSGPVIIKRIQHLRGRLLGQSHWGRGISFMLVFALTITTLPPPPVLGAAILANPNAPGCLLTRYAVLANLHQQQLNKDKK